MITFFYLTINIEVKKKKPFFNVRRWTLGSFLFQGDTLSGFSSYQSPRENDLRRRR